MTPEQIQLVRSSFAKVAPIADKAAELFYGRLQEQLAAKYDSWPLIREVSITSCMSFTAEPFFVPTEDSVQKPIREAGFTDDAYKTCLQHSFDEY